VAHVVAKGEAAAAAVDLDANGRVGGVAVIDIRVGDHVGLVNIDNRWRARCHEVYANAKAAAIITSATVVASVIASTSVGKAATADQSVAAESAMALSHGSARKNDQSAKNE